MWFTIEHPIVVMFSVSNRFANLLANMLLRPAAFFRCRILLLSDTKKHQMVLLFVVLCHFSAIPWWRDKNGEGAAQCVSLFQWRILFCLWLWRWLSRTVLVNSCSQQWTNFVLSRKTFLHITDFQLSASRENTIVFSTFTFCTPNLTVWLSCITFFSSLSSRIFILRTQDNAFWPSLLASFTRWNLHAYDYLSRHHEIA